MKKTLLLTCAVALLVGCNTTPKKNANSEGDVMNVEQVNDSIGYYGTYEGVLPAADCEGIKTRLSINDDMTYYLRSEYLGKKDGIFETNGVYNVIDDNSLIELVTPSSGETTYYKILDNDRLILSDRDGSVNEGPLAEKYLLTKVR